MPGSSERHILQEVADGRLTADEAEALLDGLAPATRVHAVLSGGGRIEVVGRPGTGVVARDDGEVVSEVAADSDRTVLVTQSFYGDGSVLVPADAALDLKVSCGEVELRGIEGSINAIFNAGPVRVGARLTRGRSKVLVNCGNLDVVLDPESDVRIVNSASVHVEVDPGLRSTAPGEWQIGDGAAVLEIDGNLGLIELTVRS